MTAELLVIVGFGGIGIERCWNRLFESRRYSWKSIFLKFYEALFKANGWSLDLQSGVSWLGIGLGPSLLLERQHIGLLPRQFVLCARALKRPSTRSLFYHPVSSRRFLSD